LSGGQRAQLALAVAAAKRPDLLILDEPLSSLDPLARREFLQGLMESATENGVSVIVSSNVVSDLERICDYFIVLAASRVRLAGDIDELRASHHQLIGPRRDPADLANADVITARHSERQTTLLVHAQQPVDDPGWIVGDPSLEDLILAYMKADKANPSPIEVLR
jgi:ABC-2 type transport system ATP-binding protein